MSQLLPVKFMKDAWKFITGFFRTRSEPLKNETAEFDDWEKIEAQGEVGDIDKKPAPSGELMEVMAPKQQDYHDHEAIPLLISQEDLDNYLFYRYKR